MDFDTNITEPIKTIRVLFPREFPAVATNCSKFPPTLTPKKGCEFPGLFAEIIKVIADYLNATIEIHTMHQISNVTENPDKLYIGRIGKTRIDGMMGHVYADVVDTICYPLQKTIIRTKVFDFSTDIYSVAANMYHRRYAADIYDKYAFFRIYDQFSWSIIGFCLILQFFFYTAHYYKEHMHTRINFTGLIDSIWVAVQLHLRQSVKTKWRSRAVKFNVILISFFQAVVILGIYSSYILSQKLTIPASTNIYGFKQLISAVQSGERYFVSTTASDWFFEALNKSDAYPFKTLRAAVRKNPIYITDTEEQNLALASSSGALAMVMEDHISSIMAKQYCNLATMEEPIALVTTHLIFKKNSPLIKPVNIAIESNRVEIMRLVRKYMEYVKRIENPLCNKLRAPVEQPYFGTCLVFLILIGTSTIVLLLEHAVWILYHKKRKSVTV